MKKTTEYLILNKLKLLEWDIEGLNKDLYIARS